MENDRNSTVSSEGEDNYQELNEDGRGRNHGGGADGPLPGFVPLDQLQGIIAAAVAAALQGQRAAAPPAHHYRDAEKLIPEFDPKQAQQTVKMWLRKVKQVARTYAWDDQAKIRYALPKLRGTAKTWYESQDTVDHTWAEWKELLKNWFPASEGTMHLMKEMERRVRGYKINE